MSRLLISSAVLALTLAGCGDSSTGPQARFDLAIGTDKPQYALATDSIATVTLENLSDRDVYLPMDSYVVYERLADGEWQDAFAWFIVDGIGRSFAVAPGEKKSDELQLWFYLPGQPGTYRFRYFVYADSAVQSLLPLEERVSGSIVITP